MFKKEKNNSNNDLNNIFSGIVSSSLDYPKFFFLDDKEDYVNSLLKNDRNLEIRKFSGSLEQFVSTNNKSNLKDFYKKIKAEDDENKIYIIEILEEMSLNVNSLEGIPDIGYYHDCVWSKAKKINNLFFVILNKTKIMKNNSIKQLQGSHDVLEKISGDDIINHAQDQEQINSTIQKKVHELAQEEINKTIKIYQEDFEKQLEQLEEEKNKLDYEKSELQKEREEIDKKIKIIEKENKKKELREEIDRINNENHEKVIEYSFDESNFVKPKNINMEDTLYDGITWLNEKNKELFNVKKSKTKIINIDSIGDSHLSKTINENLDIDSIRLETNQVKIDFDVDDELYDNSKYKPYVKK